MKKNDPMETVRTVIYVIIIVAIVGVLAYFGFRANAVPKQNTTTMKTLENGLQYDLVKEGDGAAIENGQVAVVNYTGRLENGTVFDSNVDPSFNHVMPFEFTLGAGQVIKGWDQGVLGMKVGEKRTLVIPSELAYGSRAVGKIIPANATLVFDVELVAITENK